MCKGIGTKTPDFDLLLKTKNKSCSSVLSFHCKLTQKLQGRAGQVRAGQIGTVSGGVLILKITVA